MSIDERLPRNCLQIIWYLCPNAQKRVYLLRVPKLAWSRFSPLSSLLVLECTTASVYAIGGLHENSYERFKHQLIYGTVKLGVRLSTVTHHTIITGTQSSPKKRDTLKRHTLTTKELSDGGVWMVVLVYSDMRVWWFCNAHLSSQWKSKSMVSYRLLCEHVIDPWGLIFWKRSQDVWEGKCSWAHMNGCRCTRGFGKEEKACTFCASSALDYHATHIL